MARNFIRSLMGLQPKREEDIELLNESGRIDPRLKSSPKPTARESIEQAIEGYRLLKERAGTVKKDK